MRNATTYYLLSVILVSASACKKDADVTNAGQCAAASSYALPVTNLEGVIRFDQALQQYVISRAVPGTYDSVDIGAVCGELPAAFKTAGINVRFSGTYRGYAQAPTPLVAGVTYYYLELSEIAKL